MHLHSMRIKRPSAAMVVACIALTVSLGGTSYATVSLTVPHDSVGAAQLMKNAVTSDKVRDFSLRLWDFKRGQLPRGPAGPPGPPGELGEIVEHENSVSVPANIRNGLYVTRSIQVRCQSGERAIAGGTNWSNDRNDANLTTVYSRPLMESGQVVGWRARGGSDLPTDEVFTAQVLCAKG
jgi:hypothetical protein